MTSSSQERFLLGYFFLKKTQPNNKDDFGKGCTNFWCPIISSETGTLFIFDINSGMGAIHMASGQSLTVSR